MVGTAADAIGVKTIVLTKIVASKVEIFLICNILTSSKRFYEDSTMEILYLYFDSPPPV